MINFNTECLNITSLTELEEFITEYESLLVNISYHYSKLKIHFNTDSFMNETNTDAHLTPPVNNDTIVFERQKDRSNPVLVALIKIFLYVTMIVIGVVGNFLIILVIYANKSMKNATNFFMLNLALCDLAILVSCGWIQIVVVLSENWILGEIFCKVNSYMQMVSLIASVLSLTAVSCNRFFGIMFPLRAKTGSGKSYLIIIPIIWLMALLVALPSFIYRTYREVSWSDYTVRTCDDFGWPVKLIRDERKCPVSSYIFKLVAYILNI